MRNAFIQSLTAIAEKNKNVTLLTGDLGYTVFEDFKEKFPSQFFNMGVAEANMIGVASGMAMSGLVPIVYSIATFASMRGYEQIRTDVCLHNANVKIIGTGAGLSYGHAGSTHHSQEDIGILRVLPNITIVCPSDPTQTRVITEHIIDNKGPVYMRLGKRGEPVIYKSLKRFKLGKGIVLREGKAIALIATGNQVHNALLTADLLAKKGHQITVVDMHTIKPIDEKLIKQLVQSHQCVFTLEEHSIIGGLGSAVAEVIAEGNRASIAGFHRIGISDTFFTNVGSHEYLREIAGLTPKQISKTIYQQYKKYA